MRDNVYPESTCETIQHGIMSDQLQYQADQRRGGVLALGVELDLESIIPVFFLGRARGRLVQLRVPFQVTCI